MALYANQRQVTISKTTVDKNSGKKRPYTVVYTDIIQAAAEKLNGNQFKLYMYFMSNQDEYNLAFSSEDVASKYGMSKETARTAFLELEKKGYLVATDDKKHKYIFYDKPQTATSLPSALVKKLEKRKFKDEDTNTYFLLTYKELLEMCEGDEETAKSLWEENE